MKALYLKKLKELNNPILNTSLLSNTREERARNRFLRLVKWVIKNGRVPSSYAQDNKEKSLAGLYGGLRSTKLGSRKYYTWHSFYDDISKEYNVEYLWETKDIEKRAYNNFMEIIEWIEVHKTKPIKYKADNNDRGAYLANVIANLKRGRAYWYPWHMELIEKHNLEHLFEDTTEQAYKRIMKVVKFFQRYKRIPNEKSELDLERSIGISLRKIKSAKRGSHGRMWHDIYDFVIEKYDMGKYI